MKTYYICAGLIFVLVYAVFHFAFRAGGDGQLYKINDRIAFELQAPNEHFNGITIRSYRQTNNFVLFVCGACAVDAKGAVEMVNVNYRKGDFVYTSFPQHEKAPTDIIDVRTGEAITATVPADFRADDDFSKLAEYRARGLMAGEEFKLNQNYVRANFTPLSTFTNRCFYAHFVFAVVLLFLAFPRVLLHMLDAFFRRSNDPLDPANYHRGGID